jgi:environmental stress-induced protein Ves
MEWTHLKPADGRVMPWKNGGGTTLELAIEPSGATLETGFAWRLSSAEVATSGPFSAFPGMERTLLLLEGDGFLLDFGSRGRVDLQEALIPVAFSGGWPASAALVGGPSKDLNLMWDPARCSANVRVAHLERTQTLSLDHPTVLVFVASGTLCVPEWSLYLGQRHTLRVDHGCGELHLVPGSGGAEIVIIELDGP